MDRRQALVAFLALSLAVGAGHVLLGMTLGVSDAIRGRHFREAVARAARPGMLLASGAAIGAGAGLLPGAALLPSLAALGALLLVAVVAGGFMALLELVLSLGNVMSYARLMALGLASVMLAEVANGMATAIRPRAAGVALAVLLHAVNFTLGLVSPTVAALRLHYVEFFEKFYEGGGKPFHPFAHGT
jgi:V/A-type H+-transporting ATPase subunit I